MTRSALRAEWLASAGAALAIVAVLFGDSLTPQGKQIFRYDTFGDESFWGDTLGLHEAIQGAGLGGVGPGVSLRSAVTLGLKVDADALPSSFLKQLQKGSVNLDHPATTLSLLKLNAIVGLTGVFNSTGTLQSVGIQCALCHSTVDDSNPNLCLGAVVPNAGTGCVGHRLDGWANRDLNIGAIINIAPNLQPLADLLSLAGTPVTVGTVKQILLSWGPGKYDAELILDGKAFGPGGSAATVIPSVFGLQGVNLSTWEGWGAIPYWSAFEANLEMHGQGNFLDARLDDATRFPIAAAASFGHIANSNDNVSSKLAALQNYLLSLASPPPRSGSFDTAAAARGSALFTGKASCSRCHVPPVWSNSGWNLMAPDELAIDAFQANRSPDGRYRTPPLGGLFAHSKVGFYHDGRFATLGDVVAHYNSSFVLGLTPAEMSDLIQYLSSL